MVAKKTETRERRSTIDSHYHSGSGGSLALGLRGGSKRDSSAVQADSFADERGEKASACFGRNDRW